MPIAHEKINPDDPERPPPEGVSPEDRADVLRAALEWVQSEERGTSAGLVKKLGYVAALSDDLKSEPPKVENVEWMTLTIVELLVREKKHAFVYVVVSEVYRRGDVFQVAIALRQIWLDAEGNPEHASLGPENTVLEFIRTPQGMQRVLSPTGK